MILSIKISVTFFRHPRDTHRKSHSQSVCSHKYIVDRVACSLVMLMPEMPENAADEQRGHRTRVAGRSGIFPVPGFMTHTAELHFIALNAATHCRFVAADGLQRLQRTAHKHKHTHHTHLQFTSRAVILRKLFATLLIE